MNIFSLSQRFRELIAEMNQGVYEKNAEIAMALLAAVAGESILLLGPPGVAKSMVARRLKCAFRDASAFEYLMSRFSTPDEIFGPVSIARLKDSDRYERRIDGYLPTADVVFLDEIWKAGPAIQNTLLTVINEKLFRNGDHEIHLPLKLLVAASNELPAQGEGLEALWDRFLVRMVSGCIADERQFYAMLLDENPHDAPVSHPITREEYEDWQQQIATVTIDKEVLQCITAIRKQLATVKVGDEEVSRNIYVSDRRWKHLARLLKASAFMQDRQEVTPADLLPLYHCLWNEPDERQEVRQLVLNSLFVHITTRIEQLATEIKSELRVQRVKEALQRASRAKDYRDDDLLICHHFFYQVEGHGTGNTYVFIVDFKRLPTYDAKNIKQIGLLYTDPQDKQRTLIRAFEDGERTRDPESQQVTLARDDRHIYINGVRYAMRRLRPGEKQTPLPDRMPTSLNNRDYAAEVENLSQQLNVREWELKEGLFVSADDKKELAEYLRQLRQQMAQVRAEAAKIDEP